MTDLYTINREHRRHLADHRKRLDHELRLIDRQMADIDQLMATLNPNHHQAQQPAKQRTRISGPEAQRRRNVVDTFLDNWAGSFDVHDVVRQTGEPGHLTEAYAKLLWHYAHKEGRLTVVNPGASNRPATYRKTIGETT